jgi:hypothetical protein
MRDAHGDRALRREWFRYAAKVAPSLLFSLLNPRFRRPSTFFMPRAMAPWFSDSTCRQSRFTHGSGASLYLLSLMLCRLVLRREYEALWIRNLTSRTLELEALTRVRVIYHA